MGRTWTPWEVVIFIFSAQFWRMGVLWTLQLLYSYLKLWYLESVLRKSHSYPRCRPTHGTETRRPICIITGATSGLGAAAAYAFSREGFYVILAGRSINLLSKTMVEIKQKDPDALLKAFQVDLSSFRSMLKFKNSIQKWLLDSNMHPSVQLLINNAGILATSHRFTAEGHDQTTGTNYIGAFVLTNLFLPLLKDSFVPSRVVNVTSFTHRRVSTIQVHEENFFGNCSLLSKAYQCAQVYESTKWQLILWQWQPTSCENFPHIFLFWLLQF